MPDSVPSWTTPDGKLHSTYLKALKHELFLWLSKIGENEVGARKIIDAIDENNAGTILQMIKAINDEITHPGVFRVIKEKGSSVTRVPVEQ